MQIWLNLYHSCFLYLLKKGFKVVNCYWVDTNIGMEALNQKTVHENTTVSCLGYCTNIRYNYAATKLDSSVSIDTE